jgi:hypothetical protein
MMPFKHPLGLSKYEWSLIVAAMKARQLVSNGHFLTGPRHKPAAFRMIERGFLTRAKHAFSPPVADNDPHWGIVIVITQKNIDTYNAAIKKAQRKSKRTKT